MPKRVLSPRRPVHPGKILKDAIDEFGITMNHLATALHVPANRITAIIKGTRGITAETALRLARYSNTSAEYWINLQARYDLETARDAFDAAIRKEIQPRQDA